MSGESARTSSSVKTTGGQGCTKVFDGGVAIASSASGNAEAQAPLLTVGRSSTRGLSGVCKMTR